MKILNYITAGLAVCALSACSNDGADLIVSQSSIESEAISVGAFPAFDIDSNSRSSFNDTFDAGKTEWEAGDEIFLELIVTEDQTADSKFYTLTYDGSLWTSDSELVVSPISYDAIVKYVAYYAPGYEIVDGALSSKSDDAVATSEFLKYESQAYSYLKFPKSISITFGERNYSRLRFVCGGSDKTLTVVMSDFAPANCSSTSEHKYTLTSDEKGNAYLYGKWTEGSNVKFGSENITGFTCGVDGLKASVAGKSYATDATTAKIDLNKLGSYIAASAGLKTFAAQCPTIVNYIVSGEHSYFYDEDEIWSIFNEDYENQYGVVSLDLSNIENATQIEERELYNLTTLKNVSLPNGITKIGASAFKNTGLETFVVPESVTTIAQHAFYGCKELRSVTLSSKITTIAQFIFYDCSSLADITIPEGVALIEIRAFYGCSSLKNIILPSTLTGIQGYAFWNCTSLESVTCLKEYPITKWTHSTSPFGCSTGTFVKIPVLYVPKDSKEDYEDEVTSNKVTTKWLSAFSTIVELEN